MARRLPLRSWLLELSLAAIAMLLGLFFLMESVSDGDPAPLVVEVVAGVLAFAGLVLFRRTRPVTLTLVLIPVGIVLGMPMGATPIALFAVGLHRPARVTIALTALHAVAVAVIYGLLLGPTAAVGQAIAFLVLLHVSLVSVAMLIRSQRQLVLSWAERARQAEEGQRLRIEQARLAERERIAREMHDVLAHRVSLLAVHAGALEVRRDAPASERQAAGVIRECAHDALEDLRTLISMVRTPAEDSPQPTLGDVPTLVEESRSAGAEVGLSLPDYGDVPDQTGRHAYRIIQEALTNARKHAPGAPVRVDVDICWGQGLNVHVDNELAWHGDNWHGDNKQRPSDQPTHGDKSTWEHDAPIPGAGVGLAGLHERVHLVGGRLSHGPTPSGEFQLHAWLPWQT